MVTVDFFDVKPQPLLDNGQEDVRNDINSWEICCSSILSHIDSNEI